MAKEPGMDSRDKGLATELVYGSIKYRGRIDWVLNHYAKPKVSKMDPWIRNILREGLYQLMFLDKIPPSAAVNEAVNLAKIYGKRGSEKFVNGVLRSAQRGMADLEYPHRGKQPVGYLSVTYSFPDWIVGRWYKAYGLKKAEAMCQYFNAPAPLWVRTNTLKITPEALKSQLEEQGLVTIQPCTQDKRNKYIYLTDIGWAQKEIGDRVSMVMGEIFYQGFSDQEIREFEAYQERIISNLKAKENDI